MPSGGQALNAKNATSGCGYDRSSLHNNTWSGNIFIALGILILTTRALEWLFRPKREAKTKTLESDDRGACLSAGTPASPDTVMGKEEPQRFRLSVNKREHDIGMGDMKRSLISVIVNGE